MPKGKKQNRKRKRIEAGRGRKGEEIQRMPTLESSEILFSKSLRRI